MASTDFSFFIPEKAKANSLGEPIIPFPPALPTSENLSDICQSGDARPRYPFNFFPKSGASHFRRRGKAINRMESWFSYCCAGEAAEGNSQILCCALQAVSLSPIFNQEIDFSTVNWEGVPNFTLNDNYGEGFNC